MGMDDRDGTLDLNIEYNYDTGFGKIGIEVVADTLGTHEGYQADISYSYPINFDNGQLLGHLVLSEDQDIELIVTGNNNSVIYGDHSALTIAC
jgi:outer membrane protein